MADTSSDRTDAPDPAPDVTLLPTAPPRARDEPDATQVRPADSGSRTRASAAEGHLPDEVLVAGYELLDELGRGGMGVVYKARQRGLNRLVALKMVLAGVHAGAADLARFRAEAEVVAHLQHPNIVQIFEIGEQYGRPYLALELVPGGSLQKAIAGTPQPVRPAAHLVELLARAVHFAHQRGIVHRDLKPGNVLLAAPPEGATTVSDADGAAVAALYGVPKITDFGLAKRLEDASQQTQSGDILGTPSYMAPEQAGGHAFAAGPATDVYALGAILYDMLTGRPPFKGANAFETIQQVRGEDPVPPGRLRPRLPRDLERICLKCLEKDPRRRYASALDLAADLRRHLNGESVLARPAPPLERLWRWVRRNPVPAGLLLALTFETGFGFWHLSELSKGLVRKTALDGAVQQSETMDEANRYYGRVAAHLHAAGAEGDFEWEAKPGQLTLPPPATMTIELGQQISARSESGMQIRLYSDYPFKNRLARTPPDEFEREALARFRDDPTKPYYRFEEIDRRPVLRFATARVMERACVNCHNTHPDRPPNSPVWKEGDVRGVLEVIRPLDRDRDRIREGLQTSVLIVAGSGAGLLGLSVFLLYLGNRRNRLPHFRTAPPETEAVPGADGTERGAARPAVPAGPLPDAPGPHAVTAASADTAAEEPEVVWHAMQPIGTLNPVRLVAPVEGVFRLSVSTAGEVLPVELRADVLGGAPASGLGISPCVDVPVRAGAVVVVRVRPTSAADARFTLSAQLLARRGSGATGPGDRAR
ncbi:MAG: protein kinase [Planctomycetes bacterium]|nr:protein kinase [Planctomycetota bacterium]